MVSKLDHAFEIIVVDNASTDRSVEYIRKQTYDCPVRIIENRENVGFSTANNQGIKVAQGEYVLLLNPDTMVRDDTLQASLDYLMAHPEVGALGVKMVDGSGTYLPESKRGFPSLWASFCKLVGLNRVWPRSGIFNSYYRGELRNDEIQNVDVLTGAFFMAPRKLLLQLKGLDEDFFMYGEDIDLSYRITKAGFEVVYFPQTSIIHYKGESTDKSEAAYIRNFYGAMRIFAAKHFSRSTAMMLSLLLGITIALRTGFRWVCRWIGGLLRPALDLVVFTLFLYAFTQIWASYYYDDPAYYSFASLRLHLAAYASVWIVVMFLSGVYDDVDHDRDRRRLVRVCATTWIIIVLLYAALPEYHRISRALVLFGVPLALAASIMVRFIINFFQSGSAERPRRIVLMGSEEEEKRLDRVLSAFSTGSDFVGRISLSADDQKGALGSIANLEELCSLHEVSEIVFCMNDVSATQVMESMSRLGPKYHFRMAPAASVSIISSPSKMYRGLHETVEIGYSIDTKPNRRGKRLLDLVVSCMLLLLTPILLILGNEPRPFLRNLMAVSLGKMTWVGYDSSVHDQLPRIRPAVIGISDDALAGDMEVFYYARDYRFWFDLERIFINLNHLDKRK
ncbi:MAG: glycosyltransferase family 2 protein [Saprospiraceae bacterium]|nr:glycosyltransferase family 2 protein [Saprospiraceae bacterium]